ncbi:unnamed protein product [Peniophora sp. CBMAI 1063]|nr:unnamed protein product [Peniophora sp. CBMAI 1063]
MSQIHGLSSELLQEILTFTAFLVDDHLADSDLRDPYHTRDEPFVNMTEGWNWLNVMAVCQHWRNVATASPHFHSRVALQSEAAMKRSIALSGDVPLHIISGDVRRWNATRVQWLTDNVLPVLWRLREVDLLCIPNTDDVWAAGSLMASILRESPPMLNRLRLHYHPSLTRIYNSDIRGGDEFATKSYPLLSDVELVGFIFAETSALLGSSLRSLSLSHCQLFRLRDANALHALFRGMPLLEVMDLRSTSLANLASRQDMALPPQPVHFEHLRRLSLAAPYLTIHRLLKFVTFPNTTIVELHMRQVDETSLRYGPPDGMIDFYRRHMGTATAEGPGYSRIAVNLTILPVDGHFDYAWTFSHPRGGNETTGTKLPDAMMIKWAFRVPEWDVHQSLISSCVDSVVKLIPFAHTPHTLRVVQSGTFMEWQPNDDEINEDLTYHKRWYDAFNHGLDTVTELWLEDDASLDSLCWFANATTGRGFSGRSSYPLLKVLGFRSAEMHMLSTLRYGKVEMIEGALGRHTGDDCLVRLWGCDVPSAVKEGLERRFGERLEVVWQ